MLEFQSILLITGNPSAEVLSRFAVDITHPHMDALVVTAETSVGIDEVRLIKDYCRTPPFEKDKKTVVIPAAETMTPEAQNALLKTLEEPPGYVNLVLVSPHTHTFLETVLSRCHIIYSTEPVEAGTPVLTGSMAQLLNAVPPARINLLPSTIKSKQGAMDYCAGLIREASMLLQSEPNLAAANNLALLTRCYDALAKNANPTIAVTDAVIRLQ